MDPLKNLGKLSVWIRSSKKNLMRWISRDPCYLLDDLDSKGYIQRDIYNSSRDIANRMKQARLLVDHFIDRGDNECQQFLQSLEDVGHHYPEELHAWLRGYGNGTRMEGFENPKSSCSLNQPLRTWNPAGFENFGEETATSTFGRDVTPVGASDAATQTEISAFTRDVVTFLGAERFKSAVTDVIRNEISCCVKKEMEPLMNMLRKHQALLEDIVKCVHPADVSGSTGPAAASGVGPGHRAVLSELLTPPPERPLSETAFDSHPIPTCQLENVESPTALGRTGISNDRLLSDSFTEIEEPGAGIFFAAASGNTNLRRGSGPAAEECQRPTRIRKQKTPTKRKSTTYPHPRVRELRSARGPSHKIRKNKIVCRL